MRTLLAALAALFLFLIPAHAQTMRGSWYGAHFAGRPMADGVRFSPDDPTVAAHCSLPFGTPLLLTNPDNGHSIAVTVQDRGPYVTRHHHKRCRSNGLDLSRAAARLLGFERKGVTTLEMEVLSRDAVVS